MGRWLRRRADRAAGDSCADAFAVDRLLDAVISLKKTRTLDEVDAKAVGLNKPRASVRLKTGDGGGGAEARRPVPPRRCAHCRDRRRALRRRRLHPLRPRKGSRRVAGPHDLPGRPREVQRITLSAGVAWPQTSGASNREPRKRPRRPQSDRRPVLRPLRADRGEVLEASPWGWPRAVVVVVFKQGGAQ